MNEKLKDISTSIRLIIVGIIIFSILYPVTVGVFGQIWRGSAKGSLIQSENKTVGSELIGQDFDNPKFFYSRPSSIDYNAMKSGSKNLGPQNPELENRVENILITENYENEKVPAVLVTESGSALDPHITVRSAMLQVPRVSKYTGIPGDNLKSLVEKQAKEPILGFYGLPRVNVLKLNIEVKEMMGEDNLVG